jgi:hypothetical protein
LPLPLRLLNGARACLRYLGICLKLLRKWLRS